MDKSLMMAASVQDEVAPQAKSRRGFASLDEATRRELARKGGQKAHQTGKAHEFNSEEARDAGRKGGHSVSRDRSHMASIGRKGGENSGISRRLRPIS